MEGYDLIYPKHGRPVVIYGNLGVVYSESRPYGTNDNQIDENILEDVMLYAELSDEKVIVIGIG